MRGRLAWAKNGVTGLPERPSQARHGIVVHPWTPKVAVFEVERRQAVTELLPPFIEPVVGLLVHPRLGVGAPTTKRVALGGSRPSAVGRVPAAQGSSSPRYRAR